VSNSGATLVVEGSLDGLDLTEFFLVLSAGGQAHRRCEKVWLDGDRLGVRFLKPKRSGGARRTGPDAVVG
jgi:hypothetical protein